MTTSITLIQSKKPHQVCKTYATDSDGTLHKDVVANVTEGVAKTVQANTAEDMAAILRTVTKRADLVICPGVWANSQGVEKFQIFSEAKLCEIVGSKVGEVAGGVINHNGNPISARLKRGIAPSVWVLIDADDPAGMPAEWLGLPIGTRLEMLEPVIKGISKCERIELRGSSNRVRKEGEEPKQASHAWIQVDNAGMIETMREVAKVQSELKNVAFPSPRFSRETGEVIGNQSRTLIDLSVWCTGRLVFCAKPDITKADGYVVDDADIKIINEGKGPLKISALQLPADRALKQYSDKTGQSLSYKRDGTGLRVTVRGDLTMDTPIISKGTERPLSAWVADMSTGGKLRCEAPFRASESEAAFVRVTDSGVPFVHDVGTGTTYTLSNGSTIVALIDNEREDREQEAPDLPFHKRLAQPANDLRTDPPNCFGEPDHFDARDWCYVTSRNIFVNMENSAAMSPEAFGRAFSRYTPEVIVLKATQSGLRDVVVRVPAVKFALDFVGIVTADDLAYIPSIGEDRRALISDRWVLNTFRPKSVPQAQPDWESHEAWALWDAHIKNILPDGHEELLQWCAWTVQNLGKKVRWAPIIKGTPGDGKTSIGQMLGTVIGQENVRIVTPQEVNADFNAWAAGSALAVIEEIRASGQNRFAVMDRLKPLITNDLISVVGKGRDGITLPNTQNYLALTNHEDALAIDADDRRWFVCFTRFHTQEQVQAELGQEYFDKLYKSLQDHPGVIRSWLLSIDTSGFKYNSAPRTTAAKAVMIENSRNREEVEIVEIMSLGAEGVSEAVVSTKHLNFALKGAGAKAVSATMMPRLLTNLGMHRVEHQIKWKGEVVRVYVKDHKLTDGTDDSKSDIRKLLDETVDLSDFEVEEKKADEPARHDWQDRH